MASQPTINSSNLYVDLNKQGAGTLQGDNVDQKLVAAKVERILFYSDGFNRIVNPASESTLFSAGQIDAKRVGLRLLRTQLSIYIQNSFFAATSIDLITVYRADIINAKITVTEQIDYKQCYITSFDTSVETKDGENLSQIDFTFRYNERQNTLFFFDQEGKAIGQNVSLINFPQGTLQASGGGGGGGGGGEGGGGGGEGGGGGTGGGGTPPGGGGL